MSAPPSAAAIVEWRVTDDGPGFSAAARAKRVRSVPLDRRIVGARAHGVQGDRRGARRYHDDRRHQPGAAPRSGSRCRVRDDQASSWSIEDHRPQQVVLARCVRGARLSACTSPAPGAAGARPRRHASNPTWSILDLGLPDIDGLELCRHLRARADLPDHRRHRRDRRSARVVEALDAGADDYVTKPFSMTVLLARCRVALRHAAPRRGGRRGADPHGRRRPGSTSMAYQLMVDGEVVDMQHAAVRAARDPPPQPAARSSRTPRSTGHSGSTGRASTNATPGGSRSARSASSSAPVRAGR